MTGRTMIITGACLAGLLLGGVTTGALAAPRTETATFALG